MDRYETAKKRIDQLSELLEKNNKLYYELDAPEISDAAYDAYMSELIALEAEYPALAEENRRRGAWAALRLTHSSRCAMRRSSSVCRTLSAFRTLLTSTTASGKRKRTIPTCAKTNSTD
jgi:hypothetical protein